MTDVSGERGLATQLRAAAVDVILDQGLWSFSLREVARRAEVSHAAPGYHFGDMRGLLTSVAIEGFEKLRDETHAAGDGIDDPAERLHAIGQAYVRVGLRYPGHCQVIFRDDVIDTDDVRLQHVGLEAWGVLESTVNDLITTTGSDLDVTEASQLCWSAMQGLVQLHSKFQTLGEVTGATTPTIEHLAGRFTSMMLTGLAPA